MYRFKFGSFIVLVLCYYNLSASSALNSGQADLNNVESSITWPCPIEISERKEAVITEFSLPLYEDWEKEEFDEIQWPCGVKLNHSEDRCAIKDVYWSEMRDQKFIRITNTVRI